MHTHPPAPLIGGSVGRAGEGFRVLQAVAVLILYPFRLMGTSPRLAEARGGAEAVPGSPSQ